MSTTEDGRLNHKVLPIPPPPSPLLTTNLPSTSNFIISNSSNLSSNSSNTLKPNPITSNIASTRVNKRSQLNEINSISNNKWKLEDNNNNLNYATLGVGISNLTSNGTTSIKSRSSRDSAWITTNNNTTTNSNLNSFKNQGEDLTVRDSTVNFQDDFNNIRTRKDSFNSNSSRDSFSRIGTSSSNHSLRSIHSASDNFAALRAQFHSPSAETLNSIPSSPTRSSSRIGQSKSPATRIPRPSSRLSTTKSSPSLGSISPFEAKLSSHQSTTIPRHHHHPFKANSIISQGMIPKTTYTTDLTSGEEGLEDGILLQHLRTTRSSSVELSELVGDVFGAIDWNSRQTGTSNKFDARTLPNTVESKTPRKLNSQGDGLNSSTNSNKRGNKPALMEAFMGPSTSWESRSSNIRNREDKQSEDQFRQSQASTSTLPPRPVRRSLDSSLVFRQSMTESPSSRRLQDAHSLSLSTSTIRDDGDRRPSMASSVNSMTSSAASIIYRGSGQPFPESDLDSLSESLLQEGGSLRERDLRDHLNNVAEKRTRLALFLDETAAAMEGGKSLSMVLPIPTSDSSNEGLSLSQLAEASPRPKSIQYKSTFSNYRESSPTPSTSSSSVAPSLNSLQSIAHLASSAPSIPISTHSILSTTPFDESILSSFNTLSTDVSASSPIQQTSSNRPPDRRRKTLYFTPNIQTAAESEANDTEDTIVVKRYSPVVEEGDYGLGFNIDMDMSRHRRTTSNGSANLALPLDKSSPATVRGVSPVMSFAAIEAARELALKQAQEAAELAEKIEEEKKEVAKMADKRRRTIHELLETEASYASDMVVVRDIYLARAKGTDMSAIADHVMSTGLGLGKPLSASPPSSPTTSPSGSFSGSLPPMIRRVSASLPVLEKGDPLMSKNDLHIVFANLEEIADLAEAFSSVLDSAMGSGEDMDDNIGEIFVEMIPRIQQVFSTYCARHHRAILRLQDLEPSLRTFLGECKTLSHGRTNAWDLASLLIKPVQRCLKYPLLLDQILAVTPKDHPDRAYLKRANTDMLMVAEHINDVKKRNDVVGKLGSKKEGNPRTPTSSRASSAGSTTTGGGFLSRSVTKKFLRTSSKSKQAVGLAEQEKDEMFDTLAALVETTKSTVLRFTSEMKEWSRSTKTALEAQASMVEGWIEVYAPLAGEAHTVGGGHERLCVFLETVLKPVIDGPWKALDQEVRQSLLLKTEHLLTLFDNPSAVIAKRNDKALDHAKFIAKKSSVDRRASEDFISLSSQLLEELPRFLSSVSRYFNIIIAHFATAQATYHKAVQQNWTSFANQWFVQPSFDSIESRSSFTSQQLPVAQMMETLAAGLGIAAAPAVVPRNRTASTPQASTTGSTPRVSRQRFSSAPGDHNGITTNRSSIASDSTPSFTLSSAGGSSSGTPATPPLPGSSSSYRTSKLFDHPDRRSSYTTDSGSFRTSMYGSSTFTLPSSAEDPPSRSSRYLGTGDRYDTDAPHLRNKATRRTGGGSIGGGSDRTSSSNSATARESISETFLYTAAAMASTRSTGTRGGQKILNLKVGDLLQVELEEADDGEGGGPGWLYGKMENGERGWARTEDLGHV